MSLWYDALFKLSGVFFSFMAAVSSLLSLARTSTSLFFHQRFGNVQETDPPLLMIAFVFPSMLFMVSELAFGWILACDILSVYLQNILALNGSTLSSLVHYSSVIACVIFVDVVVAAILTGINSSCMRDFYIKVSSFFYLRHSKW